MFHNFYGAAPDLSTALPMSGSDGYIVAMADSVAGLDFGYFAPRKYSNGYPVAVWKYWGNLPMNQAANFSYHGQFDTPSNIFTYTNAPLLENYFYILKVEPLQTATVQGILMEFSKKPAYVKQNSIQQPNNQISVNEPAVVTIALNEKRAQNQYFYIRYRHSNDPVGQYQWAQFEFASPEATYSSITLPAYSAVGQVNYTIIPKCVGINQLSSTEYPKTIYNIPPVSGLGNWEGTYQVQQPTSLLTSQFSVNMTGQTVASDGVYFQGNEPYFLAPMKHVGNQIYTATVRSTANDIYKYTFVNGSKGTENVPLACAAATANTRAYTITSAAPSPATVCFSSCTNTCATANTSNVTFRVNMTGQTVSGSGVKLAGSFNGFSTTANPMVLVGNNVYEATVSLTTGSNITYKFVNGTNFEIVPISCGINDGGGNYNRSLTVAGNNTILNTVCFGLCTSSCVPTQQNVTFRVNMTGQTIAPQGVFLAGTFNGFSATATPMTPMGNNLYEANVALTSGSTTAYKFVNGTSYEIVPTSCSVNDGGGNYNRSLTAPDYPLTLATVCFNKCDNACNTSLVSEITFRVDMTGQNVSASGVKLAGSFNGYSATANPMTHVGNNIYQTVLSLVAGSEITYKFVNGTNYEIVPTSCSINDGGGNYNRSLTVPAENSILNLVCFGKCNNVCTQPTVDVKFRVNMAGQSIGTGGVFLAGTFNGYSTTANQMTNVGNAVYELVLPLTANSNFTYKFVNGSTFETVPTSCGVNDGGGNYNRNLNTSTTNIDLPTVCFNACTACPMSNISFVVDMSNVTVSPQGVFLAGSFNGFSTTAKQMTHMGNNLYKADVALTAGTMETYKFVNGTTFELITSDCGIMGGASVYDRVLNVPVGNQVLSSVCFNSCNACSPSATNPTLKNSIAIYPNPSTGIFSLSRATEGEGVLYEIAGKALMTIEKGVNQFDIKHLPTGVYWLEIQVAAGHKQRYQLFKQ